MEHDIVKPKRAVAAAGSEDRSRSDLAIALRRHTAQRDDLMRALLIALAATLVVFVGARDLGVMTALHATAFIAAVAAIGLVVATWFQQRPQAEERLKVLVDDGYAAYEAHIAASTAPSGVFSDRTACWLLFTGAAIEFMILFFWSAAPAAH